MESLDRAASTRPTCHPAALMPDAAGRVAGAERSDAPERIV